MVFRLSHIHDYHRFISIDLWLYRVRAGIYDVWDGSLACSGFSSVRQSRKNWIGSRVADISGIASSIEQAIIQSSHSWDHIPEDMIMSFPSRSFISDSITSQYSRSHPESPLTMSEIDMMIARIERDSYERARVKSRKQYGIDGDDLKLVSSTIVSISIDGRTVSSPVGFSGVRVRLTVLNIFVPSSEFNIIRSIVSTLGKKPISLIPTPLILPKLIETTRFVSTQNCLIDIGYTHTTVTLLDGDEILGFEIFPYGVEMLMDMIAERHPDYSLLQIENVICMANEISRDIHTECRDDWIAYVIDMICAYLGWDRIHIKLEHLILHGSIFENRDIRSVFVSQFHDTLWYDIPHHRLHETLDPAIPYDRCMVEWLSLMASELLYVKKDPLVRLLRYVLYQYE